MKLEGPAIIMICKTIETDPLHSRVSQWGIIYGCLGLFWNELRKITMWQCPGTLNPYLAIGTVLDVIPITGRHLWGLSGGWCGARSVK